MACSRATTRSTASRLGVRIAAHLFSRLERLERLRLEAANPAVPQHRRARVVHRIERRPSVPAPARLSSTPLNRVFSTVGELRLTVGMRPFDAVARARPESDRAASRATGRGRRRRRNRDDGRCRRRCPCSPDRMGSQNSSRPSSAAALALIVSRDMPASRTAPRKRIARLEATTRSFIRPPGGADYRRARAPVQDLRCAHGVGFLPRPT